MAEELTLPHIIERNARWFSDHEAAVDPEARYTYGDLQDKVHSMAAFYHDLGVRKGDRIALMLYPSTVHVVALFAAVQLGAIPVALHVRESATVLSAVVRRLSPRVLVYDADLTDKVAELRSDSPTISGFVAARSVLTDPDHAAACHDPLIPDCLTPATREMHPSIPLRETDPAVIVLSSGTTSVPKGIVHTHRTMMESARGGAYLWHPTPLDVMVNTMTTSFIGWYNLSLPFFNVGATNVFPGRFDPQTFPRTLTDEAATVAFLVPTMWRMLLKESQPETDFSHVRLAGFAGEVMDQATLNHIREVVTPHVINIYGTTETGSCSGGTIMFEDDMLKPGKLTSVGKPLLNADIRVITPRGDPEDELPRGETGEVIIRGPSVASTVWDDPESTARIFRGPWWYSGDMGRLDEDGYLYLEGRTDDMIISGGINVLPARVEDALLAHPAVSEVAVVGLSDETWGQRVTAYVVDRTGQLTAEELDAFVTTSDLSNYQRPREYVFIKELPRTATGKLDRRTLRSGTVTG